jgi:hypothetical protein
VDFFVGLEELNIELFFGDDIEGPFNLFSFVTGEFGWKLMSKKTKTKVNVMLTSFLDDDVPRQSKFKILEY